jgi:hypothetical protein
MTRDDIIRMARESTLMVDFQKNGLPNFPALERFTELVAAAEREKLKHELLTLEKWKGMALAKDGDGRTVQEIEREAREAEREECAKLLDEMAAADKLSNYYQVAALRIRERGAP